MKVLFLSQETTYDNKRDRVTYIFILREMLSLQTHGIDVMFLSFNENQGDLQGIPVIAASSLLEKSRIHKSIRNYLFLLQNLDIYGRPAFQNFRRLLWRIQCERAILYCVQQYNIDIVHTHFFVPDGSGGTMIKKYCDVPVIATCHGSEIRNMPEYDYLAMRCRFFRESLASSLPRFDAITVPNRFYRETLLHTFRAVDPSRVTVLYNGVEPIVTPDNRIRQSSIPTFISIGKLIPLKNHEVLIQAARLLQDKFRFKVIIVGDGPLKKQLTEMIKELDHNCVTLHDEVPQKKLHNLLAASDCLVHSSFSEGGPIVVLEALALGVPCIVSDIPAMHKEIIQKGINGFFFDPAKSSELAEKMEYAILHREKLRNMKHDCQNSIRPYSREKKVKGYLALYQRLSGNIKNKTSDIV